MQIAVKLKHTTLATPIKRPHPTTDTDDESGITKREYNYFLRILVCILITSTNSWTV